MLNFNNESGNSCLMLFVLLYFGYAKCHMLLPIEQQYTTLDLSPCNPYISKLCFNFASILFSCFDVVGKTFLLDDKKILNSARLISTIQMLTRLITIDKRRRKDVQTLLLLCHCCMHLMHHVNVINRSFIVTHVKS